MKNTVKKIEKDAEKMRDKVLKIISGFEKKHHPYVKATFDNNHPKKIIVSIDLKVAE